MTFFKSYIGKSLLDITSSDDDLIIEKSGHYVFGGDVAKEWTITDNVSDEVVISNEGTQKITLIDTELSPLFGGVIWPGSSYTFRWYNDEYYIFY